MYETLKNWLDTLELDAKQTILATLALELALDYERTRNTSTAEAIRKNISELSRSIDGNRVEVDPLTELIESHKANAATSRPLY